MANRAQPFKEALQKGIRSLGHILPGSQRRCAGFAACEKLIDLNRDLTGIRLLLTGGPETAGLHAEEIAI